jgi:hypothetical protein
VAEATGLLFSPLVRELESPDELPESEFESPEESSDELFEFESPDELSDELPESEFESPDELPESEFDPSDELPESFEPESEFDPSDEAPESEESAAKAPVSEALYCRGLITPGVWQPATERQIPSQAAYFLGVFIGSLPV